jgi:hypothetical protein
MKTLVIYTTPRETVRDLCESLVCEDTDVMALEPRYTASGAIGVFGDAYYALTAKGKRIKPLDFDWSKYGSVTLISSLCAGAPRAEMNEFLYRCDFSGRDVTCIVVGRHGYFGGAGSSLRKRVRLAGGNCCGVVYLPEKKIPRQPAHVRVESLPLYAESAATIA